MVRTREGGRQLVCDRWRKRVHALEREGGRKEERGFE